jgi:hypothetical protein
MTHPTPLAEVATLTAAAVERPADRRDARQRPQQSLPTDRLKLDVQLSLLEAYGTLSGPQRRDVTTDLLSQSIGLSPATAGLCNGFFAASGWIEKHGKGRYIATDALLSYTRQKAVGDERQGLAALAQAMTESWYWAELAPLVVVTGFGRKQAKLVLMTSAGASPDHLPQVENVIVWLVRVGLLREDGDRLFPSTEVGAAVAVPGATDTVKVTVTPGQDTPEIEPAGTPVQEPTTNAPGPAGAFVSFNFHVWLSADDLQKMEPDQIRATFDVASKISAIAEKQEP